MIDFKDIHVREEQAHDVPWQKELTASFNLNAAMTVTIDDYERAKPYAIHQLRTILYNRVYGDLWPLLRDAEYASVTAARSGAESIEIKKKFRAIMYLLEQNRPVLKK